MEIEELRRSKSWVLFMKLMKEEKDKERLTDCLRATIAHLHGMQSNRKEWSEFENDLFISLEYAMTHYSSIKTSNENNYENVL